MKEFDYTVNSENGIHARPAGMLVKQALNYKSKITVSKDNKCVNLKSLIEILSLGIKQHDIIHICIEGEDEVLAETSIRNYLIENFNRS